MELTDIRELFSDIIPDPRKELMQRAALASQDAGKGLGPFEGLVKTIVQNQTMGTDNIRKGLQTATGLDLSTPTERLHQQASQIDTSTPQGQAQLISVVRRERGAQAAEMLRDRFLQQNQQQRQIELEAQRVANDEKAVNASVLNAQTQARSVDLQADRDELAERQYEDDSERYAQEQEWEKSRAINPQMITIDGVPRYTALIDNKLMMVGDDGEWESVTGTITAPTGASITPAYQKEILELEDSSMSNRDIALRAMDAVNELSRLDPNRFQMLAAGNDVPFSNPELQVLMKEIRQIEVNVAQENLPQGSASDADVAMSREPIPGNMAGPEVKQRWLIGKAKQAAIAAEFDLQKAAYMSNGGRPTDFTMQWRELMRDPEFVTEVLSKYGMTFAKENDPEEEGTSRVDSLRNRTQPGPVENPSGGW